MPRYQIIINGQRREIICSYEQFVNYSKLKNVSLDTTINSDKPVLCQNDNSLDLIDGHNPSNKKCGQGYPTPQILVNNSNISIIPVNNSSLNSSLNTSSNKSSISNFNPGLQCRDNDQLVKKPRTQKEIVIQRKGNQYSFKRIFSQSISNIPLKIPRLNVSTDVIHNRMEGSSVPKPLESIKNVDLSSKIISQKSLSTTSCFTPTSLKSSSTNKVPQEITNQQSTVTDLTCRVNFTSINDEKVMVPNTSVSMSIHLIDERINKKMVFSANVWNDIYLAVSKIVQKDLADKSLGSETNCSTSSLKANCSPETKDSKLNLVNPDNISVSTKVGIFKQVGNKQATVSSKHFGTSVTKELINLPSRKPTIVYKSPPDRIPDRSPQVHVISSDDEDYDENDGIKNKKCEDMQNKDYECIVLVKENLNNGIATTVKIHDYRMLNINNYVNDALMEFYLNYWYSRKLSSENKKRTYLFNTFFYTSLTKQMTDDSSTESKSKSRHDKVKKWTKNVNIFEKDFIFIPINENYHWFMAVICFPQLTGPINYDGTELKIQFEDNFGEHKRSNPTMCKPNSKQYEANTNTEYFRHPNFCHDVKSGNNYEGDINNLKIINPTPIKQPVILIFDSLNGNNSRTRVVETLREWLTEEYQTKHNGALKDFSSNTMKGAVVQVPQQPNYTDCGLFVMHFFQKFFECPIMDYSFPISHLKNWFSIDEVSTNCQKRREVNNIILSIMKEQGRILPSGISMPTLKFSQ